MYLPALATSPIPASHPSTADDIVSLSNVMVTPLGYRRWRLTANINGAPSAIDLPGLHDGQVLFSVETTKGPPPYALEVTGVEWLDPPNTISLYLFLNSRSESMSQIHDGLCFLQLVKFYDFPLKAGSTVQPFSLLGTSQPIASTPGHGLNALPDYLAKDYENIRRMMLDNIRRILPEWTDDDPADLGIAIVEILAYVSDYLSYYQDAVAKEAYLASALLRKSITRHNRLLGYWVSEGCAPRTIVNFTVSQKLDIPSGTAIITAEKTDHRWVQRDSQTFARYLNSGSIAYETAAPLTARPECNVMNIHTQGLPSFSLFAGITSCMLEIQGWDENDPALDVDDILVFQYSQALGPDATAGASAPQAVRLTEVVTLSNNYNGHKGQALVEVHWGIDDALRTPMPVTQQISGKTHYNVTVAVGNVVEVEFGLSKRIPLPSPSISASTSWNPKLPRRPLINQYGANIPGGSKPSMRDYFTPSALNAYPSLIVEETPLSIDEDRENMLWRPVLDLLSCDTSQRVFKVEYDGERADEGCTLHFGEGTFGERPSPYSTYEAVIKEDPGIPGNLGANTLTLPAPHAVDILNFENALLGVTNPLSATAQLPVEENNSARLAGPERVHLLHMVATKDDICKKAESFSIVKEAACIEILGGPWPVFQVHLLLNDASLVDTRVQSRVGDVLNKHRLAGREIVVTGPCWVPLTIALTIVVPFGKNPRVIKDAAYAALGTTASTGNSYFSADHLAFGMTLYANDLLSKVQDATGIQDISLDTFTRSSASRDQADVPEYLSFDAVEVPLMLADRYTAHGGTLDITVLEASL